MVFLEIRAALLGAGAVLLLVLLGWCSGFVYVGLDRSDAMEAADSLRRELDGQREALVASERSRLEAEGRALALEEARLADSTAMADRLARARALADEAVERGNELAAGLAAELNERQRATLAEIRAADAFVLQVEKDAHAATALDRDHWRSIALSWEGAYDAAVVEIGQWKERDRIRDELDRALREEIRNRGRQRTIATLLAIGVSGWVGYDKLRR